MRGEPHRREEPCNGAKSGAPAPGSAAAHLPYEAPRLTLYGSLVDLTQKRGGPGRDNPHFQRSF
jgi:hypothetical protein